MRPFRITLLLVFWATGAATGADSPPASRIPLLYCSDLFHPHDDPDDHFDLATLYAIPEFDVRGIVLDQGALQVSRPGSIPVTQLNALTGRHIPAAIGLASKLASPTDPGLDQPDQFQGGVRLILDTLRAATQRVDIIAVGSMRDLTAAFNREPELFRQRAGRLLLFIGEASDPDFREHNVSLDPHAFVGLMRSGLDLYWVPCFDGGLWRNAGPCILLAGHARGTPSPGIARACPVLHLRARPRDIGSAGLLATARRPRPTRGALWTNPQALVHGGIPGADCPRQTCRQRLRVRVREDLRRR